MTGSCKDLALVLLGSSVRVRPTNDEDGRSGCDLWARGGGTLGDGTTGDFGGVSWPLPYRCSSIAIDNAILLLSWLIFPKLVLDCHHCKGAYEQQSLSLPANRLHANRLHATWVSIKSYWSSHHGLSVTHVVCANQVTVLNDTCQDTKI